MSARQIDTRKREPLPAMAVVVFTPKVVTEREGFGLHDLTNEKEHGDERKVSKRTG